MKPFSQAQSKCLEGHIGYITALSTFSHDFKLFLATAYFDEKIDIRFNTTLTHIF